MSEENLSSIQLANILVSSLSKHPVGEKGWEEVVDWYLLLVVKQELKISEDELITMGDLMRQRALPSYT